MEEFATIKDEPLTGKCVSADYIHGYNDAVEKACEIFKKYCPFGNVDSFKKAMEE